MLEAEGLGLIEDSALLSRDADGDNRRGDEWEDLAEEDEGLAAENA